MDTGEPLAISVKGGFRGARHWLDYMSVTVTENFAMAASMARGSSVLINAASEPHVQDLCKALVAIGANITGIGTSMLSIEGVSRLHGATIEIGTDYREVTTFLALGAITGGEVRARHSVPEHFDLITRSFGKLGVSVLHEGNGRRPARPDPNHRKALYDEPAAQIEAAPWPYFSVDLLPLLIALSTRCEGTIHFWNKVYENGF